MQSYINSLTKIGKLM